MENFSSSASISVRLRLPRIWRGEGDLRRKAGERSFSIMRRGSPRSIYLLFRRSHFDCCTGCSCWNMVADASSGLALLRIRLPSGSPGKSAKPAAGTQCLPIWFEIATVSMARHLSGVRAMGIRDRPTAPRSPWQNGYVERLIGSIRRDCLDHVIVFGERHLRHVLRSYAQYHNSTRTHLSLAKDSPITRSVQTVGSILPLPILGGLHHHHVRI